MTKPSRLRKRTARKSDIVAERHALVSWYNSILLAVQSIREWQPEDGPQVDYAKAIIPIIISSSSAALLDTSKAVFPAVLEARKAILELNTLTKALAADGALFAESIDDPLLVSIVKEANRLSELVGATLKTWTIQVWGPKDEGFESKGLVEEGLSTVH